MAIRALVAFAVAATIACGGGSTVTPTPSRSPVPVSSDAPVSPPAGISVGDPVAAFVASLQAAGAEVSATGDIETAPLGGQGVGLCVAGQEVRVYVYSTPEERQAVAARIDPTDPSNLGTSIVSWAGDPKFWQGDRILVLYLGTDPAVESGLTSVLGQPFARGQGRDPGPRGHAC